MRIDQAGIIPRMLLVAVLAGCSSPLHLTYDHGRAFTEAFTAQPDLTRPAIASSTYALYGREAADIRLRVQESSTKTQTTQSTLGSN